LSSPAKASFKVYVPAARLIGMVILPFESVVLLYVFPDKVYVTTLLDKETLSQSVKVAEIS
jgi:hypothetical protein